MLERHIDSGCLNLWFSEDVDPTVGRFRNMVRTAVIPTSGNNKRTRLSTAPDQLIDFYAPDAKKGMTHHRIHVPGEEDDSDVNKPVYGPFMSTSVSTLGGISLNAAPDLEMYSIQKPLTSFGPGAAIRYDFDIKNKMYVWKINYLMLAHLSQARENAMSLNWNSIFIQIGDQI